MKRKTDFFVDEASSESDADCDSADGPIVVKHANKKRHKTAPLEISSVKPTTRFRQVVKGSGRVVRDPRFDDLSGAFNQKVFSDTYGFLDKDREIELATLKRTLKKKCKSATSQERVQASIKSLQDSRAVDEHEKRLRDMRSKWYKEERDAVKQGKKPFFLKKNELRKMELMDKFESLKKTGGVDKFIAKRRKKNAAKDHRWLAHE